MVYQSILWFLKKYYAKQKRQHKGKAKHWNFSKREMKKFRRFVTQNYDVSCYDMREPINGVCMGKCAVGVCKAVHNNCVCVAGPEALLKRTK